MSEGEWLTKNLTKAHVQRPLRSHEIQIGNLGGLYWIGFVIIHNTKVPTFWDASGNNLNDDLSLLERRRNPEQNFWRENDKTIPSL